MTCCFVWWKTTSNNLWCETERPDAGTVLASMKPWLTQMQKAMSDLSINPLNTCGNIAGYFSWSFLMSLQALGFLYAAGLGVNSSQAKVHPIHPVNLVLLFNWWVAPVQTASRTLTHKCCHSSPGIGLLHLRRPGRKHGGTYDSGKLSQPLWFSPSMWFIILYLSFLLSWLHWNYSNL